MKSNFKVTGDIDRFRSRFRKSVEFREKLRIFRNKIPDCHTKPYVFKSSDICISVKNCHEKDKSRMSYDVDGVKIRFEKSKKKVDCPCKGPLTYVCNNQGRNYCAFNQNACESFITRRLSQAKTLYAIKRCRNNFRI